MVFNQSVAGESLSWLLGRFVCSWHWLFIYLFRLCCWRCYFCWQKWKHVFYAKIYILVWIIFFQVQLLHWEVTTQSPYFQNSISRSSLPFSTLARNLIPFFDFEEIKRNLEPNCHLFIEWLWIQFVVLCFYASIISGFCVLLANNLQSAEQNTMYSHSSLCNSFIN